MYELHWRMFFMIIAMISIMASVPIDSAQVIQSQQLPPQIAALVPPGTRLTASTADLPRGGRRRATPRRGNGGRNFA